MTKAAQKYLFLPKIKNSKIMKLDVKVEKNEVESIEEPVDQTSDQEALALYKEEVDKVAEKLHNFSPRADAEVDLELQSATFETYYNSDDKYTKTPFLEDLGTVVNAAHGDWWNKNQRKLELKLVLDIGQYSDVYDARSDYNLARVSEAAANEGWHNCNEGFKKHKKKATDLLKARREADKQAVAGKRLAERDRKRQETMAKRRETLTRNKARGARPMGVRKRSTS